MEFTLREITNAICLADKLDKKAAKSVYERARMLRDKGLIKTRTATSQGRTMGFNEADVAAAVTAIYGSLSGASWSLIGAILSDLRDIENTQGRPEFENHIEAIKAGKPIWARVDVIVDPDFAEVGLSGWVVAKMGDLDHVGVTDDPMSTHPGTRQVLLWPVTLRVKPVLDLLSSKPKV